MPLVYCIESCAVHEIPTFTSLQTSVHKYNFVFNGYQSIYCAFILFRRSWRMDIFFLLLFVKFLLIVCVKQIFPSKRLALKINGPPGTAPPTPLYHNTLLSLDNIRRQASSFQMISLYFPLYAYLTVEYC